MSASTAWVIGIMVLYMSIIVFIGIWSTRYAKATLEDYAMASRTFGTWVLFSTVFAANISAVTLLGVPGKAYLTGWPIWILFVGPMNLIIPFIFYLFGNRAWLLGKRFGYMTQGEVLSARWGSNFLGYLYSIFAIFYTVPYMMTGIIGGGLVLEVLTGKFIPYWLGALFTTILVAYYLVLGGLRGAAWVNILQTVLFVFGCVAVFFVAASAFGGPVTATQQVAERYPFLLDRSKYPLGLFVSLLIINSFGPVNFPQLYTRLMAGRNAKALKNFIVLYPIASLIVFSAVVMAGMWGHLGVENLTGAAADQILPRILAKYAPLWMTGILGAAIFAALMSTLDSQQLITSTIIVRDFLTKSPRFQKMSEVSMVRWSKGIVLILGAIAYLLALANVKGIISIIEFAFAGFAVLFFPVLGALYWRRCTGTASIVSILAGQFVLIAFQYGLLPKAWCFGLLPGVPAIIVTIILLVVVSYLIPMPENKGTKEFFETFKRAEV